MPAVAARCANDILSLTADLDQISLWKDDECTAVRPRGCCDIGVRFAEGCCFAEVQGKADKFCTSMLPEDAAAREAQIEETTEALADARNAAASAETTGDAALIAVARERLTSRRQPRGRSTRHRRPRVRSTQAA